MNQNQLISLKTVIFVLLITIMLSQYRCKSVGEINAVVSQSPWIEDIPLTSPWVSDFVHDNRIYETSLEAQDIIFEACYIVKLYTANMIRNSRVESDLLYFRFFITL